MDDEMIAWLKWFSQDGRMEQYMRDLEKRARLIPPPKEPDVEYIVKDLSKPF